ncbi:MAG: hypothetical protein F2534_12875 [Actinobacteria bacterium]|nr:hypothetical protein [Actinomycetota bacterium]
MPVQFDASYPSLQVDLVFPAPIGTVDVTDYVISAETFIGRQRETGRYDASASFELDNWDGRFTPGQTAGVYSSGGVSFVRPRVGVRVRATWNSITYSLWRGYGASWRDVWDLEGRDTRSVISCVGPASILASWDGQPVAPVGDGELSGARVSRILTAASAAPFGTSIATGNVALQATDLAGNGTSQIADVVDAEGGAFWYDADGVAVFEDRASLVTNSRSNTSQVTFSAASVYFRDAVPVSGDDMIFNDVTFGREGGVPQRVTDSASIGLYGPIALSRSRLPAINDVDMLAAAEFNLARYKDPERRIESFTIDPVNAASLMWPHALGRRIRDRVTISATPARSGITWSGGAFVEGIAHSIRQNVWSTTFSFSSASAFDPFATSVFDTGVFDTAVFYF